MQFLMPQPSTLQGGGSGEREGGFRTCILVCGITCAGLQVFVITCTGPFHVLCLLTRIQVPTLNPARWLIWWVLRRFRGNEI
jgi:hypothetical protein